MLEHPGSVEAMDELEKEILVSRMRAENHNLDKELDDLFNALEIKRGSKLLSKKSWKSGTDAVHRGLSGLATFKWNYFWDADDSKRLAKACARKGPADELCFATAKRVIDAFPKNAKETEALRDLTFPPQIVPQPENNGDRLSQAYTEKKEKDEEQFQEVLSLFLNGKDNDLIKKAKEFISDYPKSMLRFRANFLIAECLRRTGNKSQAEPIYQSLIDQIPLSFYAVVAAERLGFTLGDKVSKNPLMIDPDQFNPNVYEKYTVERAKSLFAHKDFDEVGIELDSMSRMRNYTTDFLLYLIRFGFEANQNLTSFRLVNELIQRKYDRFLSADMITMLFPDRYLKEVEDYSKVNDLDPLLVLSLIKQESGFKAPIFSASGALGLMQLMPFTAIETDKTIPLKKLKDPKSNIDVGTKYLGSLMGKYNGNIPYSLSAYNAGPARVAKWRKELKPGFDMLDYIESIPFKETRDYVMAILRNRYWYQYRRGEKPESVFTAWIVPATPTPSPNVAELKAAKLKEKEGAAASPSSAAASASATASPNEKPSPAATSNEAIPAEGASLATPAESASVPPPGPNLNRTATPAEGLSSASPTPAASVNAETPTATPAAAVEKPKRYNLSPPLPSAAVTPSVAPYRLAPLPAIAPMKGEE